VTAGLGAIDPVGAGGGVRVGVDADTGSDVGATPVEIAAEGVSGSVGDAGADVAEHPTALMPIRSAAATSGHRRDDSASTVIPRYEHTP